MEEGKSGQVLEEASRRVAVVPFDSRSDVAAIEDQQRLYYAILIHTNN